MPGSRTAPIRTIGSRTASIDHATMARDVLVQDVPAAEKDRVYRARLIWGDEQSARRAGSRRPSRYRRAPATLAAAGVDKTGARTAPNKRRAGRPRCHRADSAEPAGTAVAVAERHHR